MAALATDALKRRLAQVLLEDVAETSDNNEYYIGIGKSDQYNASDTPIDPIRTKLNERDIRNNLQSVKRVANASLVIPRYNWSTGTIYSAWNDAVEGIPSNSYYVLSENNEVYICLQQGKNLLGQPVASTVSPNYIVAGVRATEAFETADGYRWKFLYALSAVKTFAFLSANFVPVQYIPTNEADSNLLNVFELQQLSVQKGAVPGQILGFNITNAGSGYTSAPTLTIDGDGSGAAATAVVSNGSIVRIQTNDESASCGRGYNFASIRVSGGGGSGAVIKPIISPINGIGENPGDDLKSSSLMLNVKPDGDEGGAFIVENDFRQISIFRNIEVYDSSAILTLPDAKALRGLTINGGTSGFATDTLIKVTATGAQAYVDELVDSTIYYHQNDKTGFIPFQINDFLEESDGNGSGTITAINTHGEADPFSGEVLYIENRARVIRDAAQQEDIKVVITI